MFQPIYSTLHEYNNIDGTLPEGRTYTSCLDVSSAKLLLRLW
ncbi:MAG: hypothetical protein RSD14_02670 [Clostridia bacterium]